MEKGDDEKLSALYYDLAIDFYKFGWSRSFSLPRASPEVTHNSLRALEALHIAPKGTVRVSETLNLCALAMAEAGRLGIFTPMYFIHARKPA